MVTGEALTFLEMDAYFRLNQIDPDPFEVEIIRRLDRIRLRVSRK